MLHVENQVYTDLLVAIRGLHTILVPTVIEGIIVIDLNEFKINGISPFAVAIALIKAHSMPVVTGNFETILVSWGHVERLKLGLVDHTGKLFLSPGDAFELFPTGQVEDVVLSGIDGTGDRIIGSNNLEGFRGDLPILPFNHHIVAGTIVIRVVLGQWSLVGYNLLVLPDNVTLLVLENVVKYLVVGENFLNLVLAVLDLEMNPCWVIFQFGLMILKKFAYACAELLAIRLGVHWEGSSNEVFRVKDWVGVRCPRVTNWFINPRTGFVHTIIVMAGFDKIWRGR